MKISQMIAMLQESQACHGDLDIKYTWDDSDEIRNDDFVTPSVCKANDDIILGYPEDDEETFLDTCTERGVKPEDCRKVFVVQMGS